MFRPFPVAYSVRVAAVMFSEAACWHTQKHYSHLYILNTRTLCINADSVVVISLKRSPLDSQLLLLMLQQSIIMINPLKYISLNADVSHMKHMH